MLSLNNLTFIASTIWPSLHTPTVSQVSFKSEEISLDKRRMLSSPMAYRATRPRSRPRSWTGTAIASLWFSDSLCFIRVFLLTLLSWNTSAQHQWLIEIDHHSSVHLWTDCCSEQLQLLLQTQLISKHMNGASLKQCMLPAANQADVAVSEER